MNRRDTAVLAALQGINERLDRTNERIDGAIHGINARLDRTNERIDTIIDVLAELRTDLDGHIATHHHDDDD